MEMIEVEAFVTIARVGGFTRAAEALHLSQPAISRRIELLERELGAPLFERVHGGIRLTDAGRAFLPHAQAVLLAVRDGAEAVRAVAHEDRGVVTLALVGTLANAQLTEHLRRFREVYPAIRLTLHTARSDEVSALVLAGDAQLGLRYGDDPHPDLVCVRVHEEAMVIVASAHHQLSEDGPLRPEALVGLPWVAFPTGKGEAADAYTQLFTRQLHAAGLAGAEVISIDSLTAQKRLIEAGFGLGMLPISSIEEERRLGTLRVLDVPALAAATPIVRIHRRRGYMGRAVRRLAETLAEAW
jgi:DNA-binding transcriptional LysR family regulator